MSLKSKFNKAKTQGFVRTFELLFNRFVPAWIFRFSMGDIYDFDLDKLRALGGTSDTTKSQNGLACRCLTEADDRLKLRQVTWNTVPIETTENDIGFAVYENEESDKILGGVWGGVGSFLEESLGIEFQFEDNQAWLYCAFVDAEARGKGVYKRLISFAADELTERGFTRVFGIVQPWNKVSRRMHEQQSLKVCGRMAAIRIFSFCWVWCKGDISIDKRFVTRIKTSPAKVRIH